MGVTIFLLGPDHWDDGVAVAWPAWALGARREPFTPNHLRQLLAERIAAASEGTVAGLVMDPVDQRPGEDDADFFQRLEQGVKAYMVILPARAKVLGTIFEGGLLVRDKMRRRDCGASSSGVDHRAPPRASRTSSFLTPPTDDPP